MVTIFWDIDKICMNAGILIMNSYHPKGSKIGTLAVSCVLSLHIHIKQILYVCMHTMYVCSTYICMSVCMYVCVYVCIYACTFVYRTF